MMMLFWITFGGARDGALDSPHTELELILGTLSNHRRFWKKRLFQLTPRGENCFFKESERKCACVEGSWYPGEPVPQWDNANASGQPIPQGSSRKRASESRQEMGTWPSSQHSLAGGGTLRDWGERCWTKRWLQLMEQTYSFKTFLYCFCDNATWWLLKAEKGLLLPHHECQHCLALSKICILEGEKYHLVFWEAYVGGGEVLKLTMLYLIYGGGGGDGATLGYAQGLILALHSGSSPGGARGTIWNAGDRPWVDHV